MIPKDFPKALWYKNAQECASHWFQRVPKTCKNAQSQKSAQAHQEKRVKVKLRENRVFQFRDGRQIHCYVDLLTGKYNTGLSEVKSKTASESVSGRLVIRTSNTSPLPSQVSTTPFRDNFRVATTRQMTRLIRKRRPFYSESPRSGTANFLTFMTSREFRWLQAIGKLLRRKKSLVAGVRFELTQHAGSKQVEDSLDFPTPN